jgi:phage tail-like protein
MTLGVRDDPLPGFNFQVSLLNSGTSVGGLITTTLSVLGADPDASFQECTGLEGTLDTETYEEGGNNGFVHQLRTRVKWQNIILKRGISNDDKLFKWFYAFTQGKGIRRSGLITLLDQGGDREVTWGFRDGLPVRYVGPALHAEQNQVAIESIEIAHHGLYQLPGGDGIIGAAASALDAIF